MVNDPLTLLDLLVTAVEYRFPNDPSSPGVIVSKIKNGRYYVSIVRYTEAYGQGKTMIHQATEENLLTALEQITHQFIFLNENKGNPFEELKKYIAPPLSPLNKEKMNAMWNIVEQNIKNRTK